VTTCREIHRPHINYPSGSAALAAMVPPCQSIWSTSMPTTRCGTTCATSMRPNGLLHHARAVRRLRHCARATVGDRRAQPRALRLRREELHMIATATELCGDALRPRPCATAGNRARPRQPSGRAAARRQGDLDALADRAQLVPDFRIGSIASPPTRDKAALNPKADLASSICWFGSACLG